MSRTLCFRLIIVVTVFACFFAFSQENDRVRVRVIVDSATVKVKPEIDGETLARIPLNTSLEAVEKQGEWYKVTFDKEGIQITGFIHEMLVREMSADEIAQEATVSSSGTVETQTEIITEIEGWMDKGRKMIREEKKYKEALESLSPLIAKTFRVEDIQKQRQLAAEIFLWMGMGYSGLGESYAALREIRNMFEVDYAFGKTITRNIYDPRIGGLIEQAEKEYLGIIKNYSLRISSTPEQAELSINDEYVGNTPMIYRSESPKILIEIKKDGYESLKEEIFLSREDTEKKYVLERLGRNVEVKTVPKGAKVFLNGKDTGQITDCVLSYVPFGTYEMKISKENYSDWQETVEVSIGEDPILIDVTLAGKTYTSQKKWGSADSSFFQQPKSMTLDNDDVVYVVDDSDSRIIKIMPDGKIDRSWASGGKDLKDLKNSAGIAIDRQGYLYITDTKKHTLFKFDENGKFIKKWGKEGSESTEFKTPMGIAIDSDSNVYVADFGNHCIKKFSNLGVFIKIIGKGGNAEGEFLFPTAVAIDNNNALLVLDRTRVQRFSLEGDFLGSWGQSGSNEGELNKPMGIFVDRDGFIYIADSGNRRIQKFESTGRFISEWGEAAEGGDPLNYPYGIVVDSRGNVYVSDMENNRIQMFALVSDSGGE